MANRPRVLLAEDEEMHSYAIGRALDRSGFDPEVVTDYEGVITKGPTADALIIDARLPSAALEGLHAAARLIDEGLPGTVPIVFISVYARETPSVQAALRQLPQLSDRYDWLQKPFSPNNVAKLVRLRIEERKAGARKSDQT